ncbi:tetraacyldisaccharide 4'-kinase [Algibacillus agarilyticus]|uniref:tetraacyldisaccharide 4'-kinase n=1 Tax=Algibacillus agarilyticus TaxID=2234133 RepID=UPI000DD03B2C|nr:tetraacyldisaccharide 4'-kinase [Algibacillus agarilyticus]
MSKIEASWYNPNLITWLLLPLSGLFFLLSSLRRLLFRFNLLSTFHPGIPVIIVGNISVGGTGKTPFTLWLVKLLKSMGLKPAIVSRGYQANIKTFPHLLSSKDTAEQVGDEPLLLFEKAQVPVVIAPQRTKAAAFITQYTNCNIIISDDGLQHYALDRDLEVILIDGNRQLGNGFLLPAGPLREGKWRIKDHDLTLYSGINDRPNHMQIKPQAPINLLDPNRVFSNLSGAVVAVSAIGNPQRFYQSLAECGIDIDQKIEFIDHHQYQKTDFSQLYDQCIIMTEKDAVKCRHFATENYWYLPISAVVSDSFTSTLQNKIQGLVKKYELR